MLKKVIALLIVTVSCAYAGLPLVELIDPRSPSKDIDGVITTKDGRKVQAHLRTFGSDKIESARNFGKSVAHASDPDRLLREKAFELYPDDPFFQKAFRQYASTP
jgi:hypothetical protein